VGETLNCELNGGGWEVSGGSWRFLEEVGEFSGGIRINQGVIVVVRS
jgi:hypothetical protein